MANPIFAKTPESYIAALMKVALNAAPGNTYLNQFKTFVTDNGGGTVGLQKLGSALSNYASTDNAAYAASIVSNLGITGASVTEATTNVKALLDTYGADRGKALMQLVDIMINLQSDATWGATANTFVNSVNTGLVYSLNTENTTTDLAVLTAVVNNQTFTLTNATDTATAHEFVAGLVYTPGGNDRINSLQDEDKLTGTDAADDVLNATLGNANDNGGTTITPTLAKIETINVAFTGSGIRTNPVISLDLQDATGVKEVNITRVSATSNNAFIENLKAPLETMSVANSNANNAGNIEFSFAGGALAGANTGKLNLSNIQVGTIAVGQNVATSAGAAVQLQGYENLTIDSKGAANSVNALQLPMDTGTDGKITITGDQNLTIAQANRIINAATGTVESTNYTNGLVLPGMAGRLASIDASAFTGNLTLNLANGIFTTGKADTSGTVQNVTVTGGKGNDTFILQDTVQAGDSLTGGDGTDTLIVGAGGSINATSSLVTKIENVEARVNATPGGALAANIDFDKLPDAAFLLVRNETANPADAVLPAVPNTPAAGVATYNLNNLTAAQAAAINTQHSNTNSNGITQSVINANLKTSTGASDTVSLTISEGLNTDPRFNVTLATQVGAGFTGITNLVEKVTLKNMDSESNTVALASNVQHTGTITLTSEGNAAAAGTFISLDTDVAGGLAVAGNNKGMYQYNVTGAADLNSDAAGATVGRVADLSGNANQVRLSAGVIDATNEAANVVVRVGTTPATVSVQGAQKITMGSGNDTVIFDDVSATSATRNTAGLSIADNVTGGDGSDTLVIDGNTGNAAQGISLGASEWTNVSGFETIRLIGNDAMNGLARNGAGQVNAYNLTLTNNLLATNKDANGFLNIVNDNDLFNNTGRVITAPGQTAATLNVNVTNANGAVVAVVNDINQAASGVTIDARSLAAGSKWSYKGNEGPSRTADRIILSDANLDGNAVIDGGAVDNITNNSGGNSLNGTSFFAQDVDGDGSNITALGNADVIEVRNAAVVSQGDLLNIKNIGTLSFTNDTAVTQVSTLQLNDTIVDAMVDSYQASVSRAAAATQTTGGANVEVLRINAIDNINTNVAPQQVTGTTGLNIQADTLTDKSDLSIVLGRGANNVVTGAGQDKVVLLGNYATATYGAAAEDGVSISAQANNVAGLRVVTDTINLGTGVDTLVTYGALDLTGATLAGIENIVANSDLILTQAQFNALTSVTFQGTTAHTIQIKDSAADTTAVDLSKIIDKTSGTITVTNNAAEGAKVGSAIVATDNTGANTVINTPVATTPTTPGTTTPTTGANVTISGAGTHSATAHDDVFKLAAATGQYEATINGGFLYSADKIMVPTGAATPSAVAGGVNDLADGKVDLTWSNNGHLVTIHLVGVDAATEAGMQANAIATVFGTY